MENPLIDKLIDNPLIDKLMDNPLIDQLMDNQLINHLNQSLSNGYLLLYIEIQWNNFNDINIKTGQ